MFKRDHYSNGHSNQNRFCGQHFKDRFEKFQQHFFEGEAGQRGEGQQFVPVNISENSEFYEVQVFAAGRKKEQFQVSINEGILTISCTENTNDATAYIYKEHLGTAFEREFQLNEQVLTDNVHASFEDGVLTVILPKDLDKVKRPQEVIID
ncbi:MULTISPECIES: Hsp20/alpha crystallin family protein [Sphingobacterium]|uniref:SHSP domain-containing protein n=1 Tax=Sphingobacterium ginsenosidimutans TaxID=687845 RepID=A0ABP7ZUQ9_9SPHI|nr:Hsp20/alpha crystallin family protein [Sphingobacterium sp. E70]ULT23917.1 Hsp20/alpha crystallin family protein [Sphingobacterium sp. E70]